VAPQTMEAVVLHEPDRYSFEGGVPVSAIGPQEVLCRVGGIPAEEAPLPLKRFVLDEIEVVGSRAVPNCLPEVLALVQSGALRLRELVTHRFPLREFGAALETFRDRKGGALKVVVEP